MPETWTAQRSARFTRVAAKYAFVVAMLSTSACSQCSDVTETDEPEDRATDDDIGSAELTPEELQKRYYPDGSYDPPIWVPEPGAVGECVSGEQCDAMYGDVEWPYTQGKPLDCVTDDDGLGHCSECRDSDDCPDTHRCLHARFCVPKDDPDSGWECLRDEDCKDAVSSDFSPLHPVRCILGHQGDLNHPRWSFCGQCRVDAECSEGGECGGSGGTRVVSYCIEPCESDADCPWSGWSCLDDSNVCWHD